MIYLAGLVWLVFIGGNSMYGQGYIGPMLGNECKALNELVPSARCLETTTMSTCSDPVHPYRGMICPVFDTPVPIAPSKQGQDGK